MSRQAELPTFFETYQKYMQRNEKTFSYLETGFIKWLIWNETISIYDLNDYKNLINSNKEYYQEMLLFFEDTLANDALRGKTNAAMSALTLKNKHGWVDKQEIKQENVSLDALSPDELKKLKED